MKIESGPAAVDFGGGQGGEAGASPPAPLAEVPEGRSRIAHLFKGGSAYRVRVATIKLTESGSETSLAILDLAARS